METINRIAFRRHNKTMEIKETKDTTKATKDIISNKWAITNNRTNSNSTNSMEHNNKIMEDSNSKIMVNSTPNSNNNHNQTIILDLIISEEITTINSNKIQISEASSNLLGSITLIISSRNSNNSLDLITSNSNSPLSNKTPIKVRRLICFELKNV